MSKYLSISFKSLKLQIIISYSEVVQIEKSFNFFQI